MPIYMQGIGQMTPAQQTLLRQAAGTARASGKKRSSGRKKKAAAPRAKKRKASGSAKRPARLVKGSKAARDYMAKIRRKKKRK